MVVMGVVMGFLIRLNQAVHQDVRVAAMVRGIEQGIYGTSCPNPAFMASRYKARQFQFWKVSKRDEDATEELLWATVGATRGRIRAVRSRRPSSAPSTANRSV